MLDAALAYAAHGFPVFPLTHDKTPVPARDKDANGKPIPGTGIFKKATTDPIQIRAWWKGNEYSDRPADGRGVRRVVPRHRHLGGPRRRRRGVGEDRRAARADRHARAPQRDRRPASDLQLEPELPIGCSSGELPDGIEVKGQGGYIVVPPSVRKNRIVHRPQRHRSDRCAGVADRSDPAGAHALERALQRTDHRRLRRDRRCDGVDSQRRRAIGKNGNRWGCGSTRPPAGQGFELFDAWSQKSSTQAHR